MSTTSIANSQTVDDKKKQPTAEEEQQNVQERKDSVEVRKENVEESKDNIEDRQLKVESCVLSTSTQDSQTTDIQQLDNVMHDFQQFSSQITARLSAASDKQKSLRLENQQLRAEVQKLTEEKDNAEQKIINDRAQWDEQVKILKERFEDADRNIAEVVEVRKENEELWKKLMVCDEWGAKITTLQSELVMAEKTYEKYLNIGLENKNLRAELQKIEEDRATAQQFLHQKFRELEGASRSSTQSFENGATQIMHAGNGVSVEEKLNVKGTKEGMQDGEAKPGYVLNGTNTNEAQDLQSELRKSRQVRHALEMKVMDLGNLNETRKKFAEDLEKENMRLKKDSDTQGAKHRKEMDALKAKYQKEIAGIEMTIDEPRALRKENERLKVEIKALKKKNEGANNATKEAGTLKEQLKDMKAERDALRRELKDAEARLVMGSRPPSTLGDKIVPEQMGQSIVFVVPKQMGQSTGSIAPKQVEQSLSQELCTVKEELAGALNLKDGLRKRCVDLESEIAELNDGVAKDNLVNSLRAEISGLHSQVSGLERDRDIKAPLAEKGAAVRMRFLAQAENVIKGYSRDELDSAVVQLGNAAAHRGDGEADAALFQAGFLLKSSYGAQFENVYNASVEEYLKCSPRWKKVFDLNATVRSSIQSGASSEIQRAKYHRLVFDWSVLNCIVEESDEAAALLEQLEAVTDEIVQLDLVRGGRRLGRFVN